SDGQPIAGCQVTIARRDAEHIWNDLPTDATGKFRFGPTPAGTYEVAALAKGRHWVRAQTFALAAGQEKVVAALRYPPCGTLRARLLDEDGTPSNKAEGFVSACSDHQAQAPLGDRNEAELPVGEYVLTYYSVRRDEGGALIARERFTIRAG